MARPSRVRQLFALVIVSASLLALPSLVYRRGPEPDTVDPPMGVTAPASALVPSVTTEEPIPPADPSNTSQSTWPAVNLPAVLAAGDVGTLVSAQKPGATPTRTVPPTATRTRTATPIPTGAGNWPAAPPVISDSWFNSPPLEWAALRGKVVLVEFWAYG